MFFYVYKITNLKPLDTRKFYIGSRSSKVEPSLDKKYLGSSKYIKDHINILGVDSFSKEILSIHNTREDAYKEEVRIQTLLDVVTDPEYYNRSIHNNIKFNTDNLTQVIDIRHNINIMVTLEEYRNNDYFISINSDMVHVRDVNGNKFSITSDEYNFNKEKYIFHTTGMVAVNDKKSGERKYVTRQDFESNEDYEYVHKNTVVVRDLETGKRTRVPKEIYDLNKERYISLNKELGLSYIIDIYNDKNEIVRTYDGNYDTQCRADGLPYSEFARSYKSNGEYKLYMNTTRQCSISKLINNGNIQYRGWYAKKR